MLQKHPTNALWWSIGLLVVVGLAFCATLANFPFPTASAAHLAEALGLDSLVLPVLHPIWQIVVTGLARLDLPISSTAALINLPLGLAAVLLIGWCTGRLPQNQTVGDAASEQQALRAQWLAGLVAAGFAGTSLPIWFVATRANPAGVSLCLLMAFAGCLATLVQRPSGKATWVVSLLLGLLVAEAPPYALLAPVLVLALVLALWHSSSLSWRNALLAILGGVMGFSVVMVGVWLGSQAEGWQTLLEANDVGGWYYLGQRYLGDIKTSWPRVGWLLVAVVTFVPWLFVVGVPALGNRFRDTDCSVFHILLVGLGAMLALNLWIAPWNLYELRQLVVLPYVATAMWWGYATGAVALAASRPAYAEPPWRRALRSLTHRVLPVLLIGLFLTVGWRNSRVMRSDHGELLHRIVQHTVSNLPKDSMLASSGRFDSMVQVVAFEAGKTVRCLTPAREGRPGYLKLVSSWFDDPRLSSLAEVGLTPLVNEWIANGGDVLDRLVLADFDHLWTSHDLLAAPLGFATHGLRRENAEALQAIDDRESQLWAGIEMPLPANSPDPLQRLNQSVLQALSRQANNLAVHYAEGQQWNRAGELFAQARRMNPENVSAFLNQVTSSRETDAELAEELQVELDSFIERHPNKLQLWSLAQVDGLVLHPDAYMQMGWLWAMSGQKKQALQVVERASRLRPMDTTTQLILAGLYLDEGREPESLEQYEQVLQKSPNDVRALLGIARASIRLGNFDQATSFLKKMLAVRPDDPAAYVELAIVSLLEGQAERASALLDVAIEAGLDGVRVHYLGAIIGLRMPDEDLTQRHLDELRVLAETTDSAALAVGSLLIASGDRDAGERVLMDLERRSPNLVAVKEQLLGLAMVKPDPDRGRELAIDILRFDPGHAFANFILGSLQLVQGNTEQAIASLEASVRRQPSPEALNTLGWILVEQGQPQAAARYARQALQMDSQHYAAWDTLGVALARTGEPEKGEVAVRKAMQLNPGRLDFVIHLAEIRWTLGHVDEARTLLESVLDPKVELPPSVRAEAEQLASRIERQVPVR